MSAADEYLPDFQPFDWSDRDLETLQAFTSNPAGLVTVLRHLPPEIAGALCSRASRASGSLLDVLLREYINPILDGEDRQLAADLEATIRFFREHGFKNILNNQRAQAFYAKWLSQYGDDSIAQITGTHVILWGVSQVAMKFIEDQRVGLEPIEKSTRYVNFGSKVGGRYLYYTPKPDLERIGCLAEYQGCLDGLFDAYVALLPRLQEWLQRNFAEKPSILEKKAFDTLRGLLPMATLGQVAFRGNAQAFEYLINRTAQHPLGELRWLSSAVKKELDSEIPSLLLRTADEKSARYQSYLHRRYRNVRESLNFVEVVAAMRPDVRLVEFDPDAEAKVIAAAIFPEFHGDWASALKLALRTVKAGPAETGAFLTKYLPDRQARWYKVGRAFESAYLRFEIVMDIGSYRDLHRHRMMTQDRQRFTTLHGFSSPVEVVEAGLAEEYSSAMHRADDLYRRIDGNDTDLAQYAVPLGYRMRFYQWQNFRQFFWETELRTVSQGHPDYRWIEQEKLRLVRERFPVIAGFVLADMNDYAIARRGTEEQIAQKELRLKDRLRRP